MTYTYITCSADHRGVTTITLDRPDKHNAFNEDFIAELSNVLDEIRRDDNCRLMVFAFHRQKFLRRRGPGLDETHGRLHA